MCRDTRKASTARVAEALTLGQSSHEHLKDVHVEVSTLLNIDDCVALRTSGRVQRQPAALASHLRRFRIVRNSPPSVFLVVDSSSFRPPPLLFPPVLLHPTLPPSSSPGQPPPSSPPLSSPPSSPSPPPRARARGVSARSVL